MKQRQGRVIPQTLKDALKSKLDRIKASVVEESEQQPKPLYDLMKIKKRIEIDHPLEDAEDDAEADAGEAQDLQEVQDLKEPKLKTKFTDIKPYSKTVKPLVPYKTLKPQLLSDCLTFYKYYPWLKFKAKQVWIKPIALDETFYDEFSEREGWFKPKEKFYTLQCFGINKHFKDGETLSVDWENSNYQLKVGLENDQDFIILNQDALELELEFINQWLGKANTKRKVLLEGPINSKVKEVIFNYLYLAFTDISPIYTNKVITQINDGILQTLNKDTVSDYIDKVANILVYLEPNVTFERNSNFIENLKNKFYNFEIISLLPDSEKAMETDSLKIKMATNEKLYKQFNTIKEDIINSILMYGVIPSRMPTRPNLKQTLQSKIIIGLPDWKKCCENEVPKDVADDKLAFYSDNNKVYCFEIDELVTKFLNKDMVNPYTLNNFSNNFIHRILSIYPKPLTVGTIKHDIQEGALIQLIKDNLTLLEQTIESFETKPCFVCNTLVNLNDATTSIYKNRKIYFCSTACFETT